MIEKPDWVKYSLNVFQELRLPEPFKELTQDQFMITHHASQYGFRDVQFSQLYLDWGEGPLIKNPKIIKTTGELYYGRGGWDSFQNFWNVKVYYYPLFAIAVAHVYTAQMAHLPNHLSGLGHHVLNNYIGGYFFRYFKLGCEHRWQELSEVDSNSLGIYHFGTCYHVYKCLNCGMTESQDSSG